MFYNGAWYKKNIFKILKHFDFIGYREKSFAMYFSILQYFNLKLIYILLRCPKKLVTAKYGVHSIYLIHLHRSTHNNSAASFFFFITFFFLLHVNLNFIDPIMRCTKEFQYISFYWQKFLKGNFPLCYVFHNWTKF